MANDDLQNFKISDQVKKTVDRPRKTASAEDQPSAGFPTLEALVEQETVDVAGLQERHAQLSEMSKSGSPKEKQAAKKATVAYERALDVVEFLVSTKETMANAK